MTPTWTIPVIFEGTQLSDAAIAIDILGRDDVLPTLSEEARTWLWRFTCCVDAPRSETSDIIRTITAEYLEAIAAHRSHLSTAISPVFDGDFSDDILDGWIDDLQRIRDLAASRDECSWCASNQAMQTEHPSDVR